ncbi:MAG TPA: hypothetical protein PKD10_00885 [Paracoccaceae bacterium]|nr:hypothetical protein [Paracoccaceae bacterium]
MRQRSLGYQLAMQRLGMMLELAPRPYIGLQRLRSSRKGYAGHIVAPGDALVIEAYPRSGSSFALRAFRQCNPDLAGRVGTHIHSAAHVTEAVRLGVPALVLIRTPDQAVPSLVALGIQTGTVVPRDSAQSLRMVRLALDRYIRFHRALLALAERVAVADFSQVISDFGQVIARVNDRFGTDFAVFDHKPEAVDAILRRSRRHLGPDPDRETVKERLQATYRCDEMARRRAEALALYQRLRVADAG